MIRAPHLSDAATIQGRVLCRHRPPSLNPTQPPIDPSLQSLPDATTPSLPPDHDQHYHILMSRHPCKACRGEYVRGCPVSQAGRRAGISPSSPRHTASQACQVLTWDILRLDQACLVQSQLTMAGVLHQVGAHGLQQSTAADQISFTQAVQQPVPRDRQGHTTHSCRDIHARHVKVLTCGHWVHP
ncbi:hypothetical protein HaLaN_10164 [Haematococcus lacustris]|uniref:Uncharacterized protein n=1 Tax=Haematococcus lacustris TaxID=44745 RepID=A0A699YVF1_HAELA|nr:hypothetical protein HaLaN_10164 [Haematococcus lacustris]